MLSHRELDLVVSGLCALEQVDLDLRHSGEALLQLLLLDKQQGRCRQRPFCIVTPCLVAFLQLFLE